MGARNVPPSPEAATLLRSLPMAAPDTFYRKHGKRVFDVVVSATALACASPIIAGVAALVATKLGRPVLFRQERAGRHGKPFHIYKFRSMTDERGPDGNLLPDEVRLTPFGSFLRKTSLDELPELWNILKGDMSLVGPRPLLQRYVPRYSARQARRHEVRPGLTGLVAVNGRNTEQWEQRFERDVQYVDTYDLALDLRIIGKTIAVVFSRENVDPIGQTTMPEFQGLRHVN